MKHSAFDPGESAEVEAGEESMKKKIVAAVLGCVMMLSAGCTKSNILKPEGQAQPDFSIVTDVELEWNQINDDLVDFYEDSDEYPGLLNFNYAHKDEEKMIQAQLFVDDTVNGKKAASYASDMIKYLNDCIAVQNNSLALSSNDSYGGFFDDYGFTVQVIPEATKDDESTWLVNMTVAAGEHTSIVPLEGAAE